MIPRGAKMPRLEKWRLTTRKYGNTKLAELYLYPELNRSSCVQDFDSSVPGEEQVRYYIDYIRHNERYAQWWDNDAVPIYWSVMEGATESGFGCEAAPCEPGENVLTHYYPPINDKTGAQINWYKLPVLNRRFPQFAEALSWLPAPFQATAPLRSIVLGAPRCMLA